MLIQVIIQQIMHEDSFFHDKVELLSHWTENPQQPLTSGFCIEWEGLQLAFTPGSNDSALVTCSYRLHL